LFEARLGAVGKGVGHGGELGVRIGGKGVAHGAGAAATATHETDFQLVAACGMGEAPNRQLRRGSP
jgi:hypothetical protein